MGDSRRAYEDGDAAHWEGSACSDFGASTQELFQYIRDNPERWERLRWSRVQDVVDMKLFRADGSTAGSVGKGSLSDGQRNTAALALMMNTLPSARKQRLTTIWIMPHI